MRGVQPGGGVLPVRRCDVKAWAVVTERGRICLGNAFYPAMRIYKRRKEAIYDLSGCSKGTRLAKLEIRILGKKRCAT